MLSFGAQLWKMKKDRNVSANLLACVGNGDGKFWFKWIVVVTQIVWSLSGDACIGVQYRSSIVEGSCGCYVPPKTLRSCSTTGNVRFRFFLYGGSLLRVRRHSGRHLPDCNYLLIVFKTQFFNLWIVEFWWSFTCIRFSYSVSKCFFPLHS